MREKLLISIVAVCAFVAGVLAVKFVGTAWASIPGPGGVITGCYVAPKPGTAAALKVIDTGNTPTCPGKALALPWNEIGPTGIPGPQGPAGPQGPQGPPGSSGAGNIAFMDPGNNGWVLRTDGTVWSWSGSSWQQENPNVPTSTSQIVEWTQFSFLDT